MNIIALVPCGCIRKASERKRKRYCMKTIRFLLLVCFCTLAAGIAVGSLTFQIIGLIACIAMLCVFFVVSWRQRNQKRAREAAQALARQVASPQSLGQEYRELTNFYRATLANIYQSPEQLAAVSMNKATADMLDKYGYTAEELGQKMAGWY